MRVLLLCPYPPGQAASQRFRFEQYLGVLKERNFIVETSAFLDEKAWRLLYAPGHHTIKMLRIAKGFIDRFLLMFRVSQFDFVFIHREAAPLGPAVFEWVICKVLKKKVIYDFDDAIWIPNSSESNRFFSFLKFHGNVKRICQWSYKVSCGNNYLCEYALQYNTRVIYNPTTIDTENHHNRIIQPTKKPFVIGWTGSHSTNRYLDEMVPVIKKLEEEFSFDFVVISDVSPELPLKSFRFKKWQRETEIDDLLSFSVGIMPLVDDKWAQGKCGFKALQYMSLGIPALVSPVGVNTRIVDHGMNGYICKNPDEWYKHLKELFTNPDKLQQLSGNTRKKIESHYSVHSNTDNFIQLFT